jgi:hypothetical protein
MPLPATPSPVTELLSAGSPSLRTIRLGTTRLIPSPEAIPPSALPKRLLDSLCAFAPVLPELETVGFYALDFKQQYVRSSDETVELGLAAAEARWKVVDKHGDCWLAAWASAAGDVWEPAEEGAQMAAAVALDAAG